MSVSKEEIEALGYQGESGGVTTALTPDQCDDLGSSLSSQDPDLGGAGEEVVRSASGPATDCENRDDTIHLSIVVNVVLSLLLLSTWALVALAYLGGRNLLPLSRKQDKNGAGPTANPMLGQQVPSIPYQAACDRKCCPCPTCECRMRLLSYPLVPLPYLCSLWWAGLLVWPPRLRKNPP